jgi:hypothetical protein
MLPALAEQCMNKLISSIVASLPFGIHNLIVCSHLLISTYNKHYYEDVLDKQMLIIAVSKLFRLRKEPGHQRNNQCGRLFHRHMAYSFEHNQRIVG